MKFELYNLATGEGKHIRMATKVTLADGRVIKFMERLSNKETRRQVERLIPQVTPQDESKNTRKKCRKCYGTGRNHSYPFCICPACNGTGIKGGENEEKKILGVRCTNRKRLYL